MLTPDNNREMQAFAMQSLDQMMDEAIRKIMSSPELLLQVFSITEYCGGHANFPFDV
jgi:hypothetical protein